MESADGTAIHYAFFGSGPTPLVFVHGWACDQTYWSSQTADLAEDFTVVTLDLAGHGLSGRTRTEWSIPNFSRDVVAVLEALNLNGAVLIGHSLGGPIVLEAAGIVPERVAGVIGVDTFHDGWALEPFETLLDAMRSDFRTTTTGFVRGMFIESSPPELVERVVQDMVSQDPHSGIAALEALEIWAPTRMAHAIEDLALPFGAIQTTAFRSASSFVEAKLQDSPDRLIEMPGLGHFLMAEDPVGFNETLRSLIAKLGGF